MNNDIRFYDFDFNLLYILPQSADKSGYTAVNATIEFSDFGNIEITFYDNELKSIIRNKRDKIIVIWRDFQGYITSYMFTETTNKLFGKHLNGLLKRVVIPTITASSSAKEAGYILNNSVLSEISWLNAETGIAGKGEKITYSTEKYMTADKAVKEINELSKSGYMIKADIKSKTFTYCFLPRADNSLMLSVSNLNIYEPELTYKNTDMAFGGWYEKKTDDTSTWTYITNDSTKTGIYKIDTVLSAETEEEAQKELNKCISDYEIAAKTKTLEHGTDYNIGDIVRVQIDGVTEKRLVSGINMWNEQSYGEEPILTEI